MAKNKEQRLKIMFLFLFLFLGSFLTIFLSQECYKLITSCSPSFTPVRGSISYIKHSPIDIDENADFGPSGYNFPGKGTWDNPFLIVGYEIIVPRTHLIVIHDTDAYFIINNSLLNGITKEGDGILLSNVTNGIIINNIILNTLDGCDLKSSTNNIISNNILFNSSSNGIHLESSTNNTLHNNVLYNTRVGFYLQTYSHNNTVSSNTIYSIGAYGIFLTDSSNTTIFSNRISESNVAINLRDSNNDLITNNLINDNGNLAFYLEDCEDNIVEWNICERNNIPKTSQAFDDSLNNNFSYNYWSDWTSPDENNDGEVDTPYSILDAGNTDPHPRTTSHIPHDPIVINSDSDFETLGFPGEGTTYNPYRIENYEITNSSTDLIFIQNTHAYFQITNNLMNGENGDLSGIKLSLVKNGQITYNDISNCSLGILLEFSSRNRLDNNKILNNTNNGIRLSDAGNNILTSNSIYQNREAGIHLHGSSNNIIDSNIASDQIQNRGIYLTNSHMNTISNNLMQNNRYSGIGIWTGNNNNITNNIISHNGWEGIWLRDTAYTTISNCTISYSDLPGVVMFEGHDNIVTLNTFIDNSLEREEGSSQIIDEGEDNIIDYNCYSDWTGPDSNNDGIVDNPYLIDGFALNSDLHPLVFPEEEGTSSIPTTTLTSATTTYTSATTTYSEEKITPGYIVVTSFIAMGILFFINRKHR